MTMELSTIITRTCKIEVPYSDRGGGGGSKGFHGTPLLKESLTRDTLIEQSQYS